MATLDRVTGGMRYFGAYAIRKSRQSIESLKNLPDELQNGAQTMQSAAGREAVMESCETLLEKIHLGQQAAFISTLVLFTIMPKTPIIGNLLKRPFQGFGVVSGVLFWDLHVMHREVEEIEVQVWKKQDIGTDEVERMVKLAIRRIHRGVLLLSLVFDLPKIVRLTPPSPLRPPPPPPPE